MTHSHVWQNNNQTFTSAKTTIKYSRLLRQQLNIYVSAKTTTPSRLLKQWNDSGLYCCVHVTSFKCQLTLFICGFYTTSFCFCCCCFLLARHSTVHPSNYNTCAHWCVPLCIVLSPQHPPHPMVLANEQCTQWLLILLLDYCRAVWHTNPSRSWSLGSWAT